MNMVFRVLRWPLFFAAMAVVLAGLILSLNPSWIRIDHIEVDLAQGSDQDVLFERIKTSLAPRIQSFQGRYFWQVPLSEIFDLTAKDKRVKRVSIYREFPSRMKVEIEPYTPILAYLAKDGRVYPVATDATLLPGLAPADAPDLPFLRGPELKDKESLRETAIELYRAIPNQGELSKAKISEIIYSKKDGFKIYASGAAGEIRLGDTDFGPKVSRVQKVLSYLESQNIQGRVIDARFTKKVFFRVRKDP
jgi:cell division septal protein FtsQ